MRFPHLCPDCDMDLDDYGHEVRCWKCGWAVHSVTNPIEYFDRADAIQEMNR